ncbi:MAG: hypothetical protein ACRDPC_10060, partial [Solirubrobacteraceae bacterium]
MRIATTLETVGRHPRHLILLAATAGLLVGPLSRPATILAATTAAALAAAATRTPRRSPVPGPRIGSATRAPPPRVARRTGTADTGSRAAAAD